MPKAAVSDPRVNGGVENEQFAALPYAVIDGRIIVCLMTSRETQRWIIPKGWPKRKLAPHQLAAAEAMEEAGLSGVVSPAPLGSFTYLKRLSAERSVRCVVKVYPLLVMEQALDWPERTERRLIWLPAAEAAGLVEEPELAALIAGLEDEHLRSY